jgi:DNA polymerase-3 subunit delta'
MPELLDIIGQDSALAHLQRALLGTRRPHAYILAGPEGVGRRTTAVEFAKLLLCERPRQQSNNGRLAELPKGFALQLACGACPSCRTVSAETNPDLQVVYKELARYHDDAKIRDRVMQDLGIEVIRKYLIAPAYLASSGGRGKVFIVRQAELMSVPAQNALLKTLEEPPAQVTIMLICHSPGELLPTTRSRCQVVRFGRLAADFVAQALADAGVDKAEAAFWAAFSDGSPGLAGRLAEQDLYEFKRNLVERLAAVAGGAEGDLAETLTRAMQRHASQLQKRDKKLAATLVSRQAGGTILAMIASVYRDALSAACGASRPLIHADQAQAIRKIARRFDAPTLANILAQLSRYEQLLWRNVNPKLLWDNVAVTCTTATALEV